MRMATLLENMGTCETLGFSIILDKYNPRGPSAAQDPSREAHELLDDVCKIAARIICPDLDGTFNPRASGIGGY